MEAANLLGLINQLDGNLGQLEETLEPILEKPLNATSKKLPLLERAKLNIIVVYAVESLIFSYLKVNGVDAREHPIFKELERTKQYFNKIKEAEEKSVAKPSITLNKQAAARIIQHSLAGNGSSDLTQREREARERLLLMRKQKAGNSTSTPNSPAISSPAAMLIEASIPPTPLSTAKIVDTNQDSSAEEGEIEDDSTGPVAEAVEQSVVTDIPNKKRKNKDRNEKPSKLSADRKAEKKARKKARKDAKAAAIGAANGG